MPSSPLILVTGATGYIAGRLIPPLLEKGFRVRAMARNPERLQGREWFGQVEMVRGDVTDPASLAPALEGSDTAYYLIHNMSRGHGYTEAEIQGAENFVGAAEEAGLRHIVYLGGLADPEQHIAPHLRSRIETGKILRQGRVPVTEFRAGVIAGSGSISFEMIRFMTEFLPVIPAPAWIRNRTQPIAIQNVVDYLLAALETEKGQGRVFEIGGPEMATYGDLMLTYARVRGLKRKMLVIPRIPVWFMAFGVGLITPVPFPIASALIGGLSSDSIVRHPEALTVFPNIEFIDFDSASRTALEATRPDRIQRVWEDGARGVKALKHEGCFILHKMRSPSRKENQKGAFHFGCNSRPDRFHKQGIRGRNHSGNLSGLFLDSFETRPNHKPGITRKRIGLLGEIRLERRTDPDETTSVTLFLIPHGSLGFLISFLLQPILRLWFYGFM